MKCRLLVVARRFWPIWEESCQRLIAWTTMLAQNGVDVTVLTGRWHTFWPAESGFRDLKIVRLLPGPKSAWNETLFLRNVGAWVTKHRKEFDKIYVDESVSLLHQLAYKHVIGDRPLIARYHGLFVDDVDASLPFSLVTQACDGCRKADLVIAANPVAQRQLQATGILADRIVRIPDVAWEPIHRDVKQRNAAARALRAVNHDFLVPNHCKLLTYIGDLIPRKSTIAMLDGMIEFVERKPEAMVWLLGAGKGLSELYDRVKYAGMHHQILFQSPFDDWESILQISDGIICPHVDSGAEYLQPQALASGIPMLACRTSPYRHLIPESLQQSLIETPTKECFLEALVAWFDEHSNRLEEAEKARQLLVGRSSLDEARRAWLEILKA